MKKSRFFVLMLVVVVCAGIPSISLSQQIVNVQARFAAGNPQIFPIGRMVDIDLINDAREIDFESMPELVYLTFTTLDRAATDTTRLIFNLTLDASGVTLIDFWSQWFWLTNSDPNLPNLETWENQSVGNTFSNRDINQGRDSWLRRNSNRGGNAAIETFLGLLDGPNLQMALYTVSVNVYKATSAQVEGDWVGGDRQTVQVYNPSPPTIQNPIEGDDVFGHPIFFSWTWSGGAISNQDVNLIIVEADENDPNPDPREVIDNRNLSNTRYEGAPSFTDYHIYTGAAGAEQSLIPGKRYFWMVEITVPTVILGEDQTIEGIPGSFRFIEPGGEGGQEGGEGEGDPQTGMFFNQLGQVISDGAVATIQGEMRGYVLSNITFDDLSGRTLIELGNLYNTQGFTVITTLIE